MPLKHPQMTITDFNYDSSYLPGLTCNMDVRAHIGRSTGRSTPLYCHLVVKNGNFTSLLLEFTLADQLADLPPPKYWHLVVKNGSFTFLLLEFMLADYMADLPPLPLSTMHHGMSIMGCNWQSLWILQEKVGICFYF